MENENDIYKATVIGSGPSGIAIIGQLISRNIFPILWIDPNFDGGKMSSYRKVPANTRASFFINFMKAIPAYNEFLEDKNNENNPMDIFRDCDLNSPPSLNKAYEMCISLIKNIEKKYKNKVFFHKDMVNNLQFQEENKIWEISTNSNSNSDLNFLSEKIILAIGSKPKKYNLSDKPQIPLEILVNNNPKKLQKYVNKNDTIGVIGSSHSSILSLMHLENLPYPPKKIHCFYRENIKYAVHTDKGIIYDNIGLKGKAAIWAKEYLETGKSEIIKMHLMENIQKENKIYEEYLPECTKIAPMIGWERNNIPIEIKSKGEIRKINNVDYNGTNLKLICWDDENKKFLDLENIWGIGIAFPRHVKDLSGIMGMDVGIFKFGKAAKIIEEQIIRLPKF